jgi:hypothetical protein
MTAELFRYRNKDGCLIILYDDEERAAVHAAQTLLHRVSSTYNGLLTVTYATLAVSSTHDSLRHGLVVQALVQS